MIKYIVLFIISTKIMWNHNPLEFSSVWDYRVSKMDQYESEIELLQRSREERRQIVAKYDKGRESGAKIDDWEDPSTEIYHTQDRYGFIQ